MSLLLEHMMQDWLDEAMILHFHSKLSSISVTMVYQL